MEIGIESPSSVAMTIGEPPRALDEPSMETFRLCSGFSEFDRVLGGGIVPGSIVLLGGEPGIGKSTFLLQLAASFAAAHGPVLYVSGEESFHQIQLRAGRLGIKEPNIKALNETDVMDVLQHSEAVQPRLLIVDSIQTMVMPGRPGYQGGVTQVRECAGALAQWAKATQTPCVLVGHITKAGGLAGPKLLEHMVDVVLYFEGDHYYSHRLMRAAKNRYGATHEMALFNMEDAGLSQITNPSAAFLAERHPGSSGTVVTATLEGSLPLMVEIQALVAPAGYASARRLVTGLDSSRIHMILAVLERRGGLLFNDQDVYASAIGGVRLGEPAVDLGISIAVASGLRDQPVPQNLIAFGEVGLTGEIRRVGGGQRRLEEAVRLGFTTALVPRSVERELGSGIDGITLIGVGTIGEALAAVWG